jgi:glycosyltransferase involved in cell wall biosynthesis
MDLVQKPINIEVLLATYNGEKYLAEQLDSLLAQVDVSISLTVSDDGSQDGTLEILEKYRKSFCNFKILNGPQRGPQANFFYLLSKSTADYVALCDQDDIWEREHLKKSLSRLGSAGPMVTFSSVNEFFTDQPEVSRVWPKKIRIRNIENILFENPARGCTIVMNKEFVRLVTDKIPEFSIMHDWWIALVGISFNCLSAASTPEVRYRIHQDNHVGSSPSLSIKLRRARRNLSSGQLATIDQLSSLDDIFSSMMIKKSKLSVSNWIAPVTSLDLFKQVCSRNRFRSSRIEDLGIRCIFIWKWLMGRLGY